MTKKNERLNRLADAVDQPEQSSGTLYGMPNFRTNIPKMKVKSYEEITATSTINLPRNQVKPVNQRIFAIAQDPGEMKTDGGILLPTTFNLPEAKQGRKREILRYFVVDVADDCTIEVPVQDNVCLNYRTRKLERGDEIFPFIPAEAEAWNFPLIYDFYTKSEYIVFHQTELGGVGMSSLLKKEGE